MKCALLITQECNLACQYCYIGTNRSRMSLKTAEKTIELIYRITPPDEDISIGFFGGEPLIALDLLKQFTNIIKSHLAYSSNRVEIQVTTNGTLINGDILDYLAEQNIGLGVSIDGSPVIQNKNRRFRDGSLSSALVEKNILMALARFPELMVNAVYTPETYMYLPESVRYLYDLGLRRLFINPDFSAHWSKTDCDCLKKVYDSIVIDYINWYKNGDPAFISLIDSKLIVILNNGYKPNDRCQMGLKEIAVSANGNIFPCERLVGDGSKNIHCLGNVEEAQFIKMICRHSESLKSGNACNSCTLNRYCMNWCGCSNYFSTGDYNLPGYFLCSSEKASVAAALDVFEQLDELYGPGLLNKISRFKCLTSDRSNY